MFTISPKRSSVVVNVSSRTSVMSLSLDESIRHQSRLKVEWNSQHPLEATVELGVNALQVGERDFFL